MSSRPPLKKRRGSDVACASSAHRHATAAGKSAESHRRRSAMKEAKKRHCARIRRNRRKGGTSPFAIRGSVVVWRAIGPLHRLDPNREPRRAPTWCLY
eukprot:scaffold12640_cov106-Isochrysis_galbana.AAC.15